MVVVGTGIIELLPTALPKLFSVIVFPLPLNSPEKGGTLPPMGFQFSSVMSFIST